MEATGEPHTDCRTNDLEITQCIVLAASDANYWTWKNTTVSHLKTTTCKIKAATVDSGVVSIFAYQSKSDKLQS